jgi:tetratricopeptide (TPR) repeat protein
MERRSATFIIRGYRMLTEVQGTFSADGDLYSWMGTALMLGKQYPEAQRAYARAFALDPASATKETDLGQAYSSAGEWNAATQYLEDALAKDNLNLSAATLLMNIYKRQGNAAKAMDLSERVHTAMK